MSQCSKKNSVLDNIKNTSQTHMY